MCRYLHIGSAGSNNFGWVRRSFPMRCSLESILDDYFSRYNFVNAMQHHSIAEQGFAWFRLMMWREELFGIKCDSSKPGAAWSTLLAPGDRTPGPRNIHEGSAPSDRRLGTPGQPPLNLGAGYWEYEIFSLIDNWCVGWTGPAAHYRPVVARSWEWVINDGTILTYVIPTRQLHKRWNDQWTWRVWQRHLSPA